ncbi:MAG: phage holin family protein [Bacteroidaceae bacterium]|nr:phage holin family protein [Bacteroidaceae bacterium]
MTSAAYLFGGLDTALLTLAIVMALDYITGICKAIKQKKLNSKAGVLGILKKFGYLVIVALAVVIDRMAGDTGTVRTLVIYFFVANDGLSILENWGAMGLPLPKKLFEVLEQLKNDNDPE